MPFCGRNLECNFNFRIVNLYSKISRDDANQQIHRVLATRTRANKKKWRCEVSISVPVECESVKISSSLVFFSFFGRIFLTDRSTM